MKYKVRRQGVELGELTLEELIRRRDAGEFSGDEYVQQAGATDWQPLNLVLESGYRTDLPKPLPLPANNSFIETLVWTGIGLAVITFIGAAVFGFNMAVKNRRAAVGRYQTYYHHSNQPPAVPASVRPIVWTTNSETAARSLIRAREFRVRQWFDGYKERGQRDPEYDQAAVELLQDWIADNYGGPYSTNHPSLADQSDRLVADPQCNDPLVLTVAAINNRNYFQARHGLERAFAAFPHSRHRAYPEFYANLFYALQMGEGNPQQEDYYDAALISLRKCFQDGSFTPEDQQEIAELFLSGLARHLFYADSSTVCQVVRDAGPDYQWLALCLNGEWEINLAWSARGGGYADTVTSQGWQGFSGHLAQARKDFTAAWNLQPSWPLAPERMIYVSLGDSDIDEMRTWFDRTTTAQMDYDSAYKDFRWGLRPRWYGNESSLLAFGRAALDTRRFDTDVPRKYMDAVLDVESEEDLPPGRHLFDREDVWPNLQRLYQGYLADPSQAGSLEGWRSSYAAVAYFAGKYNVARTQLNALGWQLKNEDLSFWNVDLSRMPLEVAARTGSLGTTVDQAEFLSHNGDPASALKTYQVLPLANADAMTRQFIQLRLEQLGIQAQLQKGEWVNWLPTDTNDLNWVARLGTARCLPDGALEVEFGLTGHMLYCLTPVGNQFEVRGQLEVVRTDNENFQGGLVMGVPDPAGEEWYGFRLKRHDEEGDVVGFDSAWSRTQTAQPFHLNNGTNTFDFTFHSGTASAVVNGVTVFQGQKAPAWIAVPDDSYLVGLGAFSDSPDEVVRYRNVQLRRLDY